MRRSREDQKVLRPLMEAQRTFGHISEYEIVEVLQHLHDPEKVRQSMRGQELHQFGVCGSFVHACELTVRSMRLHVTSTLHD